MMILGLLFLVAVGLGFAAVGGLGMSAIRRGRPWLIAIPIGLALVAIEMSPDGPLSPWIRYPVAIGIPLGIALPLVLPAKANSLYVQTRAEGGLEARRDAQALAFGWLAFSISLIWTWYLVMDPSCRLGHGGGC